MRIESARTPAFLLTGFLGSGKTTLLNAALRDPALVHSAVIVNEMGDIGLDQLVVGQAIDNVMLLAGGCLCCANTGALHETLADLIHKRARGELPPFERVIVETSGTADPAPLLQVLLGHPLVTADYALAAVICTVDALNFQQSRAQYPELDKQAAMADRIVITKRDLANAQPIERLFKDRIVAGDATAFRTQVSGSRNFIARSGALQSARTVFRAFAFRPGAVTWAGWAAWSQLAKDAFGERLLRVKGLLRMADTGEIALVQGVQGVFHPPHRFRDWPDADHGNRLVCIARDLTQAEIETTLPALNAAPGTQAIYSLRELQERQAQQ